MDSKNEFVYVGIECMYCPDLIDIGHVLRVRIFYYYVSVVQKNVTCHICDKM